MSCSDIEVTGGTAGLTIATRLAEGNATVAVIEAGSFYQLTNGNLSQVPGVRVVFKVLDGKLLTTIGSFGLEQCKRKPFSYNVLLLNHLNTFLQTLNGVNGLIDWRFQTTAQTQLQNRTLHFTRGKCLGGSSARNYMVFNRGLGGNSDVAKRG